MLKEFMLDVVPSIINTNACKLVILFFEILPNFHDQIIISEMSVLIMCLIKFHPLSNGLIIGFESPVFMIDVCGYTI